MLDLAIELLALVLELFLPEVGLLLQVFEVILGLISGIVGLPCKFDGFLDIFLFVLQLPLQLGVNILHGILLLPELIDLGPQLAIV